MKRAKVMNDRLVPLGELLEELSALHEALHETLSVKLEAMRRSNVEGMLSAAHREGELAAKIAAADARRSRIVEQLCGALEVSAAMKNDTAKGHRATRLSEIVARLEPASAIPLTRRATALREAMLKVAQANRVVELVSREMLAHFRALFGAMMDDAAGAGTYRPVGGMEKKPGPRVLDAVG